MGKRIFLTLFLMIPPLALAVILFAVAHFASEQTKFEPVGAGAGDTGGANAIGEWLGNPAERATENIREAEMEYERERNLGLAQPRMVAPESLEQGFIIVVKDETGLASNNRPIFLASNYNGWNPGNPEFILEGRSDLRWQIAFDKPASPEPLQFKFTLGSWDEVETDPDGNDIPNRTLPKIDASKLKGGQQPTIEFVIPAFREAPEPTDAQPAIDRYRAIDAVGTIRRVQVASGAGGQAVSIDRDLIVWLPPGYDDAGNTRTYPVMYMQDGQNLFEQLPGVPGEWNLDETATKLIQSGQIEPVIIVGIPHSYASRGNEYLPFEAYDIEPFGDHYAMWLQLEVVPKIERAFRVKEGREHTIIGGSSLGAVIALWTALEYPETFGMVYAESLSGVAHEPNRWIPIIDDAGELPLKVYLGMGGEEGGFDAQQDELNAKYVRGIREVTDALVRKGMSAQDVKTVVDAEHAHNEDAWNERASGALRFLLGK